MPLYFAYGSNMDAVAMQARCPKARLLGRARLARHRLALMADGYATVVRAPASVVHGVLYDLAQSDIAPLDRYEEVARGLYAKVDQPVLREAGGPVRALVYVGRAEAADEARRIPGYGETILAAARAVGLPGAYIEEIARLLSSGAPAAARPRAIKWTPKEA
ncbi:MAG: gamma-glutamylcyclotransferase [Hyphomicrobiales bacterium]|nr:gamma-glutamylcyclotransferase [Hyphomicrobiales bacterium]